MSPGERVWIWTSILFETLGAIFMAAPLTWSALLIGIFAGAATSHELLEQRRGVRAVIFGLISGTAFGVSIAAGGLA